MVKKWDYLAVKSLPRLLHGITSNHNDAHYCMNCLHSFRTNCKLKSHQNVYKNNDYCNIKMPEGWKKILKFTQNHKSLKIPFVIYADTEFLLEKIYTCDKDSTK